jgi:glycosyltransferase involved in cell wall biosynthesis
MDIQATDSPSNPAESLVSVIICTYGRATALLELLEALNNQTYRSMEILVVDGNEEPSPARAMVEKFANSPQTRSKVTLVKSPKGLTRQRNVGLEASTGDLICFLDDDVTFENDFLARVANFFGRPDMQDVGGITGYDVLNYPMAMSMRWYLRWLLGVMPGRDPGRVDHLGRAVPISFLKPWPGLKTIGWLPGFCMIYRGEAIEGVRFDELLPTYGGEDRDFSMRVRQGYRLVICGDLHLKHHYTVEGRDDDVERLLQCSFGAARRFAKYAKSIGDYFTISRVILADFIIDVLALIRSPRKINLFVLLVRFQGLFEGFVSVRADASTRASSLLNRDIPARHPAISSGNE